MGKLSVLVAGGVGYVLGARAGRQRYEQIRSAALRVKGNPTVQHTASTAAGAAKGAAKHAAPVVKDTVTGVAGAAVSKVKKSDEDSESPEAPAVPLAESAYPHGAPGSHP